MLRENNRNDRREKKHVLQKPDAAAGSNQLRGNNNNPRTNNESHAIRTNSNLIKYRLNDLYERSSF